MNKSFKRMTDKVKGSECFLTQNSSLHITDICLHDEALLEHFDK